MIAEIMPCPSPLHKTNDEGGLRRGSCHPEDAGAEAAVSHVGGIKTLGRNPAADWIEVARGDRPTTIYRFAKGAKIRTSLRLPYGT